MGIFLDKSTKYLETIKNTIIFLFFTEISLCMHIIAWRTSLFSVLCLNYELCIRKLLVNSAYVTEVTRPAYTLQFKFASLKTLYLCLTLLVTSWSRDYAWSNATIRAWWYLSFLISLKYLSKRKNYLLFLSWNKYYFSEALFGKTK